jgi:hypothetical protein
MMRRREQTVETSVLAFWRARLATLQGKLAETPGAGDAWFWKVQCHVIQYLIQRYDDDKLQMPANSRQQTVPAQSPQISSALPLEVKPSHSFSDAAGMGKMPRSSGEIRRVLSKIIHINQPRYKLLQRLGAEMADAMRQWQQQNRDMMRGHSEDQLRRNATRKYAHDALEKLSISTSRISQLSDQELRICSTRSSLWNPRLPKVKMCLRRKDQISQQLSAIFELYFETSP